ILQLARECVLVGLVDHRDAQPVVLERRNLAAKAGRGAILQNGLHAEIGGPKGSRTGSRPRTARSPSACSIRSASFHFAVRSDRAHDPTFSCPAAQPTAR